MVFNPSNARNNGFRANLGSFMLGQGFEICGIEKYVAPVKAVNTKIRDRCREFSGSRRFLSIRNRLTAYWVKRPATWNPFFPYRCMQGPWNFLFAAQWKWKKVSHTQENPNDEIEINGPERDPNAKEPKKGLSILHPSRSSDPCGIFWLSFLNAANSQALPSSCYVMWSKGK